MNLRLVGGILLSGLFLTAPAHADKRVALVSDMWSSTGMATTSELANVLSEEHGFHVTVADSSREGLKQDIEAFKARIAGSELALVVLVGGIDHNENGTSIQLMPPRRGSDPFTLELTPLLDQLVRGSKAAVVVLQQVERSLSTNSSRKSGVGRLPEIDGRLQIAFAPYVGAKAGTILPALTTEIKSSREQSSLDPAVVITAARDVEYIRTQGLRVARSFGSLPTISGLKHPRPRSRVIESIWERANALCKPDLTKSRVNEAKVLGYFSGKVDGLSAASMTDNDTFTLERFLRHLEDLARCPFGVPDTPPADKSREPEAGAPREGRPKPEQKDDDDERRKEEERQRLQQEQERRREQEEQRRKKQEEQQRQEKEEQRRKEKEEQRRKDKEELQRKYEEPKKSPKPSRDNDSAPPRPSPPQPRPSPPQPRPPMGIPPI